MNDFFKSLTDMGLQSLPNNLVHLQDMLAKLRATGEAGTGAVVVTLDGNGKMVDLVINTEIFSDPAILIDCIRAAHDRALEAIERRKREEVMKNLNPATLASNLGGGMFNPSSS
ncbi:MAG: YbaB/EbfC family nucleoid-associated protein [Alphaproteobacteria bacterium]|nr:YbaB/EbfC family nucleoid-associated protein [Alphaproteobacteria bacterium]